MMSFSNQRSSVCGHVFFVAFLLPTLIVSAYEANKTAPESSSPKITSEICDKVLPSISRGLQSRPKRGPDRIVNGDLAPHMAPYMAALISGSRGFFCSATLLSEYWALTAAHCTISTQNDVLRVGGTNVLQGTDIEIEEAIPHPQYFRAAQGTEQNDLQLIKLKAAAPADSKFFYINEEPSHPSTSSFVRACGYGDTRGTASPNSGVLREVDVPVQDSSLCQYQYEDIQVVIKDSVHICAGYNEGGCDSCYGDSGGSLFTFGKDLILVQVGIVSFGLECALPLRPGVYTRVSHYIPWMKSTGAVFMTTSEGINVFGGNIPPSEAGSDNPDGNNNEDEAVLNDEQDAPSFPPQLKPPVPQVLSEKPEGSNQQSPACFPANAVVTLEDGNEKNVEELLVGDRVRVGPHEFSAVFMFTHRRRYGHYEFVQIECQACTSALVLSLDHVLSVNGIFQPARAVRVGDSIIKASGKVSIVTHVSLVREKGLFNPQTIDGRIIVNDVQVTTYTTAIDKQAAHALLTPLRFSFKSLNWLLTSRV